VAGPAATDRFVLRGRLTATGVARHRLGDASHVLKDTLHAPETPASQDRDLSLRRSRRLVDHGRGNRRRVQRRARRGRRTPRQQDGRGQQRGDDVPNKLVSHRIGRQRRGPAPVAHTQRVYRSSAARYSENNAHQPGDDRGICTLVVDQCLLADDAHVSRALPAQPMVRRRKSIALRPAILVMASSE
jgi:hypothetical protein